ncbi:MAG TPA: heme o synthase [Albitalea sp.]|nr:heme o synthase [Albitalea sp.]
MATPLALPLARPRWKSYVEVTKPRVVALMLFTVFVGMLLSTHAPIAWQVLVFGPVGIALVAAAAAAINHLVDRRIDALMARTRGRPLPRGALDGAQVAAFAACIGGIGMALLLAFTNTLCALLTFASLIGYAVVYSMLLKHATPHNIVIGGAAGAAPPLLGWVAVTGQVDAGALLLFLIIFVWTPPHFWALAIHRRDDYARAAVPMLPVTHGVAFTSDRILHYTLGLCLVSLVPFAIGLAGWIYLAGAAVLGARFATWALRLCFDARLAMRTFRYSIVYLFSLFALLLLDHYLPLIPA